MFKSLLVSALAALAAAQSATLGFTRVPNPVTAGQQVAITYNTADPSSPVTIILRKGAANNLDTVDTLTTSATGGQFIWTPSNDLENAADYALQIEQGSEINYFGPFAIQGATGESDDSSSSATGTATGSSTRTATGSSSTITATASYNSSSVTLTATISASNSTTMSRNQTMSSATLSRTSTSGPSPTSSNDAGFQEPTQSASGNQEGAASVVGASALALVLGAVAAIVMG